VGGILVPDRTERSQPGIVRRKTIVEKTHFGFQQIDDSEKAKKVGAVFSSVASKYDVMNDLMSAGLHRLWKAFTIQMSGVKVGSKVLDVAAGSGDLTLQFANKVGPQGRVWMTDINSAMLLCDAEKLPFPNNYFDCVSVAFGLRNMTHKDQALSEMRRVLKPGGRLLVLEFSKIWKPLEPFYDVYSFKVLPFLGKLVANDAQSYQYLAESIRMHPNQEELKAMMQTAGLAKVDYFNLAAGAVALHRGYKLA
jgi:demethylmenaquinone methyltransferase/2-methoxy-6-polyprenyl-1,4-benzoquinol methylase